MINARTGFNNQLRILNGPNKNKLSGTINSNANAGNNEFNTKSLMNEIGNVNRSSKCLTKINAGIKNNNLLFKFQNGIKLGNPSKITPNNGLSNEIKPSPSNAGNSNAPINNKNGTAIADTRPIPLINNGAANKLLILFSTNNGNPPSVTNNTWLRITNGNVNNVNAMSETSPAPSAMNTDVNGLMNNQYGIDKNKPTRVTKLIKPEISFRGNSKKRLKNASPALTR